MEKPLSNRAWLLVLPVVAIVAFNAIMPLMTVVNYSVQDTFGNNQFFWNGVGWYKELLDPSTDLGGRFFAALGRNVAFSLIILAIEVPLGILVALCMPKAGPAVAATPRRSRAAAARAVERGRHDLADLRAQRHRPSRLDAEPSRDRLQLHGRFLLRLVHDHRHGRLALDEPDRAPLLRRTEIDPGSLLSGGPDRRRLAAVGVPLDRTAQAQPRAADRRAPALHGQLHDLHRALRRDRRGSGQFDDDGVDRPRQDRARPVRSRQGGRACRSSTTSSSSRPAGSSTR